MSFVTEFRGISAGILGSGHTLLFWKDLWNDFLFCHKYPRLFSFAKNTDIFVQQYLQIEDLYVLYNVPLTLQAAQEFDQLQLDLTEIVFSSETNDSWSYIWGNSNILPVVFMHTRFIL